jgi:alcohol dehydrogenase
VVSDDGVVAAGHTQRAVESLQAAGLAVEVFSHLHVNPTTQDVEDGLAMAREFRPDVLIGVGGGSSMDCAKGINFVYTGGGTMHDYWGEGKAVAPMLPMIAVPTTAGTGSEAQSYALISDAQTHVKMACGDKKAAFRVAVLDPRLTLTQPALVTALTGMDAVSHALETYVTRRRTVASLTFSRQAWELLAVHYPRVLSEPQQLESRAGTQLGACLAGLAIENSMLGATHALANPLTARYEILHGQAIALMLPHVIRFNGQDPQVARWYGDLQQTVVGAGGAFGGVEDFAERPAPEVLAELITALVGQAGLKTRLGECGVEPERLPELAKEAAAQWTGTFNPRTVGEAEFLQLYRLAM